jgi:hypothetical protein
LRFGGITALNGERCRINTNQTLRYALIFQMQRSIIHIEMQRVVSSGNGMAVISN